jgi:hypothetical protein
MICHYPEATMGATKKRATAVFPAKLTNFNQPPYTQNNPNIAQNL